MTGDRFLLDTNIVTAYFNQDPGVLQRLQGISLYVPSIVLGELFYGAIKSQNSQKNIKRVRDFAALSTILACDAATAEVYGLIKQRLEIKGRPIPENDIWIAAIARQHGLTLITRDEHFQHVENLPTEKW